MMLAGVQLKDILYVNIMKEKPRSLGAVVYKKALSASPRTMDGYSMQ